MAVSAQPVRTRQAVTNCGVSILLRPNRLNGVLRQGSGRRRSTGQLVKKRLHQDLRLPDERLRRRAHGRRPRARGLSPRRPTMEEADLVILNTCHIREKAAEKVYSELGRVRRLKRARAAGGPRRRRSRSPAASPRPRAGRSCAARRRSTWSSGRRAYHRLPELLARAPRRGAASSTPTSRPRTSSTTCRAPAARTRARRLGLPHRAGGLRQVLHLLRRALHPRRRGLAAGRARSSPRRERLADAGRARGHAARPERQRLSRRRAGRRAPGRSARLLRRLAEIAGHRAAALHHQPPARHGRRPDRRPSRPAGADALPAPAGAVGLGPHPRGHEPPAHGATTIAA